MNLGTARALRLSRQSQEPRCYEAASRRLGTLAVAPALLTWPAGALAQAAGEVPVVGMLRRFELNVNLKTAQALNPKVPDAVLLRAHEVIR